MRHRAIASHFQWYVLRLLNRIADLEHCTYYRSVSKERAIGRRTRNLFDPASDKPFKISRSKIELFRQCPRCFYLDRRLGIGRPSSPPFTLNNAVDGLLKKEFDQHRRVQTAHPLMGQYAIDAIPFAHPLLDQWRENFKGLQVLHEPTNLLITGAVDDLWVNPAGELHVVDYKATSTIKVISLDDEWKRAYKRQMEVYQWLLRHLGFTVSNMGYFVYVNALQERLEFAARLECAMQVIPYEGDCAWLPTTIEALHACLTADCLPAATDGCEWCAYQMASKQLELVVHAARE